MTGCAGAVAGIPRFAVLALCASLASAEAWPVDLSLESAWMRPAPAGATARVYVDIVSDTALVLTRASSPAAASVQIIAVGRAGGEEGMPVTSFPVPANAATRFAYHGNHLRFVDVKSPLANGGTALLTLEFRDDQGITYVAFARVEVRGLVAPVVTPR
jgi:copper(I)-binding protein